MSPRFAFTQTVVAGMALGFVAATLTGCQSAARTDTVSADKSQINQAHAVLTVAESKRLIAKAVAKMPLVENALRNGMVIVAKGTTNTYVAEELLGQRIPRGGYVIGHVLPEKGGKALPKDEQVPVVVLVKGRHRPDLTLDQALEQLGPGDVVIKGGNALDYANRTVGVWTGSATGGTAGKVMPVVEARKAHLVIPIGLEKTIVGRVTDIAARTMETADDPSKLPRMRVLKGEIVTEIEALRILADVDAFEASSGGIGGAEGAVWMVWRGSREDVEKARKIVETIHGEPPFIP